LVGGGWGGVVRSGTGGDGVGASGVEVQKLSFIPGRESIVQSRECVSLERLGSGKSRKHGWKLGSGGRKEGEREETQLWVVVFMEMR